LNSDGAEQSNYYKVLSAAFSREGHDGVERVIDQAHDRRQDRLPSDQTPTSDVLAQAAAEMAEHRYAQAREIYHTILAREPNNAEVIANYGICLCCLGSTMPGPRNPVRHNTFARMFHLLGRLAESETAYRNSLAIDPTNPTVISDLSQVVAGQKRFDEALQLADRVLALAPDSAVGYVRKALIFEQANRPAEARNCIQTALQLDPDLPEAPAALARLTGTG
jgi:Tfp pilus assembly protein PilF